MQVHDQLARLDELIDQIPAMDQLARQVQIDDVVAGARTAKQLNDIYDEWFTNCLAFLPRDLMEKFRFEYQGANMQYRVRHFLNEPVKPRPKFFGGGNKRPSEFSGLLSYWQHPYADRFQAPLRAQKRLLMEARARLAAKHATPQHIGAAQPEERTLDRDRTVFVIHGRDKKAWRGLFDFLHAIGLQPMEWSRVLAEVRQGSPKIADVLPAVMNKGCAIIVLATPDDVVQLRPEHADDEHDPELRPQGQARPNVIYETGMAMMVAPERTILVEFGAVRRFTDLNGHFVVRLNNDAAKRKLLAERLREVGCAVDLSGSYWLEAGDLTPPTTAPRTKPLIPRQVEQSGVGELQLENFTVTPDHTVYGEVYNHTGATKNVILKVTFYGASGRILGTGTGGVSALAAEQSKTFTLTTLDDVSGWQDFKVDVDSSF